MCTVLMGQPEVLNGQHPQVIPTASIHLLLLQIWMGMVSPKWFWVHSMATYSVWTVRTETLPGSAALEPPVLYNPVPIFWMLTVTVILM